VFNKEEKGLVEEISEQKECKERGESSKI